MIQLIGGELYQWDTGRTAIVKPVTDDIIHEVHFTTKDMDSRLIMCFGYVFARGTFPDDEDTLKTARMCLERFVVQFGEPYAYIKSGEKSGKSVFEAEKIDDYLNDLADCGAGSGIQFRFSLEGKNERMSDDGSYVDCCFLKPESTDGQVRIQFTMTLVDRDV